MTGEIICHRCRCDPCACSDGQSLYLGDAREIMRKLGSVDLVFGSPPYCDARTYGIKAQRTCEEWVDWMLAITEVAAGISTGPVIWVAAGVTRDRNYWPACEGLMWEWWRRGGEHQLYRPCAFHRVGIPGSGGKDWFRADWEYVMCFKPPGALAWADNTAAGHRPRWVAGSEISHRLTDGQWRNQCYTPPAKANPGNLLTGIEYLKAAEDALDAYERGDVRSGTVGGGHMGDRIAHNNEAPFPEWLAEVFVCSFCPPGGIVVDPFCGSGTTLAVARKWGRRGIGIDLRASQCDLTAGRLEQGLLF